jgi:hypothetical protein
MTYRHLGIGLLSLLLTGCMGESAGEGEGYDLSLEPEVDVRTTAVVPAGTPLSVVLIDPLGSEISQPGDTFLASLAEPLSVNGSVVFTKGTTVQGRVRAVEDSGRIQGRAHIELELNEIRADGRTASISTKPFSETAQSNTGRDVAIGAAGGTAGAVIGGLAGGKTGAVIGGAAGAAGSVMATKGEELFYPTESHFTFTLSQGVEVLN